LGAEAQRGRAAHGAVPRSFCEVCGHTLTEAEYRSVHHHLERQAQSIAQALHDESGQLLTAAHLALCDISPDVSDAARKRLDEVRKYLDSIEEQLRRIAHEIRPRLLEEIGLVAALEFLGASVEKRRGIVVTVDAGPLRKLAPTIETTIYRVVQEALNNVTRHAQAARATIQIRRMTNALHCLIQDNGVGFDVDAVLARRGDTGMGLIGMRERLGILGGWVDVRSAPGRGTDVEVVIPLED
jgi:signal transduction histidine kinase